MFATTPGRTDISVAHDSAANALRTVGCAARLGKKALNQQLTGNGIPLILIPAS
jgi:hypothetical protein